ncbi:MAG: hypothetical protein Q4A11_02420 [Brachymonas sp.]|nr:hypothetical protein [Brachymonas sp.]
MVIEIREKDKRKNQKIENNLNKPGDCTIGCVVGSPARVAGLVPALALPRSKSAARKHKEPDTAIAG